MDHCAPTALSMVLSRHETRNAWWAELSLVTGDLKDSRLGDMELQKNLFFFPPTASPDGSWKELTLLTHSYSLISFQVKSISFPTLESVSWLSFCSRSSHSSSSDPHKASLPLPCQNSFNHSTLLTFKSFRTFQISGEVCLYPRLLFYLPVYIQSPGPAQ